jgi:hypothetical protein
VKIKLKIHFQILTLLIAALTLSMPFVTVAQQSLVPDEAATEYDAKAVILEAKVAAEHDASSDTNKLLWFGAGFATVGCAGPLGALAGCLVGAGIDPPGAGIDPPPESDSSFLTFGPPEPITGSIVGMYVGCAVGVSAPLIQIYNYQPNIPSWRLIGKSPEYVDSYTDAYRRKARSIRTGSAAGGVLLSAGSLLIITNILGVVAD